MAMLILGSVLAFCSGALIVLLRWFAHVVTERNQLRDELVVKTVVETLEPRFDTLEKTVSGLSGQLSTLTRVIGGRSFG